MSETGRPPRLARRLIRWALPEDRRDDITGDLDELFQGRSLRRGRARAHLWYWGEAMIFSWRFLAERFREGSRGRAASGGPARFGVAKVRRLSLGISLLD